MRAYYSIRAPFERLCRAQRICTFSAVVDAPPLENGRM